MGGLTATNLLYTLSILPHLPPPFQFLAPNPGSVREELFTFDPNKIFRKPVSGRSLLHCCWIYQHTDTRSNLGPNGERIDR